MKRQRVVDDWTAGAYLRGIAAIEIRWMARSREPLQGWEGDDYVACIAWLSDLIHTMPAQAQSPAWPLRAGKQRPMQWVWQNADLASRAWITHTLDRGGMDWTPPPTNVPAGEVTGTVDGPVMVS